MDTHNRRSRLKLCIGTVESTVPLSSNKAKSLRALNTLQLVVDGILLEHTYNYSGTYSLRECHKIKMALTDMLEWLHLPVDSSTCSYARIYFDALVDVLGLLPTSHEPESLRPSHILATQLITSLAKDNKWQDIIYPLYHYVNSLYEKFNVMPAYRGGPANVFALVERSQDVSSDVTFTDYVPVYHWERALKEVARYKALGERRVLLKLVARIPYREGGVEAYVIPSHNIEEFEHVALEDMPHE